MTPQTILALFSKQADRWKQQRLEIRLEWMCVWVEQISANCCFKRHSLKRKDSQFPNFDPAGSLDDCGKILSTWLLQAMERTRTNKELLKNVWLRSSQFAKVPEFIQKKNAAKQV